MSIHSMVVDVNLTQLAHSETQFKTKSVPIRVAGDIAARYSAAGQSLTAGNV